MKDWSRWLPAIVTVAGALVAWGSMQADLRSMAVRVDRLERLTETSANADASVLQRLTAIEVKLEAVREALTRRAERP